MHTIGKTTFNKIETGEVFAIDGCWIIWIKIDSFSSVLLADDFSDYPNIKPGDTIPVFGNSKVYRLPKSVQAFWKGK